jgi:hypothetical protein
VILADKGTMLFETGKQEEGLEMVKQVERTDSGFLAPHRFLANMYWNLRAYPDFLAESEKMTEIDQDPLLKETTAAARAGFERDGERGLLHDLYVAQKKLYAEGKLAGYFAAGTCVRLGRKEEALQLLRDDYDRHRAEFLYARTDLDLLTLKDEPGYQELMGKLRFPGSLPAVEHDAAIEASLANTPAAGGQR